MKCKLKHRGKLPGLLRTDGNGRNGRFVKCKLKHRGNFPETNPRAKNARHWETKKAISQISKEKEIFSGKLAEPWAAAPPPPPNHGPLYGSIMGQQWANHGSTMGQPWGNHGTTMGQSPQAPALHRGLACISELLFPAKVSLGNCNTRPNK